jgi:hypothetical protein
MSGAIPGTPPGYNTKLDLFCRAGDTAVAMSVSDTTPTIIQNNTIYSDNRIAFEIEYPGDRSSSVAAVKYDGNIFIGFRNPDGEYPAPIFSSTDLKMFTNPGASFSNNVTYRPHGSWKCPATKLHETKGSCSDPHLKDETWHAYGYGDSSRTPATGKDMSQTDSDSSQEISYTGIAIKSLGVATLVAGVWTGFRYLQGRGTKT